jgi:hypothetical protein
MKTYALFFFGLFVLLGHAQTGIGTTTPNASAKLDVYATDKGFLPPRIALTATNAASPISSPANGLMVFNTASAGASPFNVVPGYYYWDGTGQQWVSLSTTVGNVQNQAIFRSTASTTYSGTVSSWATRFNNVAPGDLTFLSSTTFALSNGIYKIQWGLPYQTTQTYNLIQLQENISGTWTPWKNDIVFANLGNGGNTDWGGGTFMTDVIDCSTSTKTLRLVNGDGSRILLAGASFIITKLNPSITTSTTADNLGDHTATKNILLNGNYLSNDGGNEGIRIDNSGKVGIGTATPTVPLEVNGAVNASTLNLSNGIIGTPSLVLKNGDAAAAFSDIQQIRMGWSGSAAGKSQYAQTIHTRHNSGNTSNAIDFYLSDGTADNTITSGSTRAMTITSPGDVEIAGKITIGNSSGNVVKKVAGFVNAGDYIVLDNLKVRMAPSGYRSIQVATVSGTYTVFGSDLFSANGAGGTTIFENNKLTITTNPTYLNAGLHFAWGGYTDTWTIMDTDNFIAWRITCIIGNTNGAYANFITIERLL